MPMRPPSVCAYPGCAAIATERGRCADHQPAPGWSADTRSRHERGYGAAWSRARRLALERDKYLCVVCAGAGRVTVASEVDHITPKFLGGSDSVDNLQAICHSCHKLKTSKESCLAREGERKSK